MTTRIDRSMNDELRFGGLDGRVRSLRPDTANAEMEPALARSRVLHSQHFGSLGVNPSIEALADYLPGCCYYLVCELKHLSLSDILKICHIEILLLQFLFSSLSI